MPAAEPIMPAIYTTCIITADRCRVGEGRSRYNPESDSLRRFTWSRGTSIDHPIKLQTEVCQNGKNQRGSLDRCGANHRKLTITADNNITSARGENPESGPI